MRVSRMIKPLLVVALSAIAVQIADQRTAVAEGTPTINRAASEMRRYTKAEIRQIALGKSKAEVRAALGPPSNVIDRSVDGKEAWYYWPEALRIYDPDAGITIPGSVSIIFSLASGVATDVRF
jgi:outer membrane protein assembly factor BamE (lipoprotein component of BamABCDE complex)